MANTSPSSNMSMPIPVVGQQTGPQYAININDCLTILDGHNHTPGSGAPITSDALNINADLPINDYNITLLRSARFSSQNAPLALASDLQCVYVVAEDLYYNDSSGNQIRITQNGAVAGTPGSIANLVPPASAAYVSGSATFVWQSDTDTAANLDAGSIILRNLTPSSFGLTLSAPTLGSNYSITLPALPASAKFVSIDSSGEMAAVWDVDNSTLEIAANVLRVKPGGITATQMASGAVNIKSETFTSNDNFDVPAGITQVIVYGCGGGGGGGGGGGSGGGQGGAGGGGGGGAIAQMIPLAVTPLASMPVVVGTGGLGGNFGAGSGGGGPGGNGTAGSNGASSTFGGLLLKGGLGGSGGAGGTSGGIAPVGSAGGAGGSFTLFSAAGGNGGSGGTGSAGYNLSGSAGQDSSQHTGGAGGVNTAPSGNEAGGGGGGGGGITANGAAGGAGAKLSGLVPAVPGSDATGLGAGGGGAGGGYPGSGIASGSGGGDGSPGFVTIIWIGP